MPLNTNWLKYLWKERRPILLRQTFRIAALHRTPFRSLLENILRITEEYQAGFTFPIVASSALRNPELIQLVLSFHQEVASHGFYHVNYTYLSPDAQSTDILRSILAFKSLKTVIRGFRAPYNVCTDQTPRLLEKFGFLWDGSFGFKPQYRELSSFFRVEVDNHMSSFVCIPLYKWSDDRMIDVYGLDSTQMAKILKRAMRQTKGKCGVIMFDLHPIRIGQPKYNDLLKQVLAYGTELNGWFPTVTEAVEQWFKHHEWKDGASFCCLLTGDIDSLALLDYLRRLF